MQYLCTTAFLFSLCFFNFSCFLQIPRFLPQNIDDQDNRNRGGPLILTPYIKKGKLKEARAAARVNFEEFQNVESYSGFFTVDERYNSNLFFWFFPSKTDYQKAPVLLWLQGGPGFSSMFGLFAENGPFVINEKGGTDLRNRSWVDNHSVIYVDNPVGTGFSFTDGGFAQNQTIVGEALYTAIFQFFQVFSELQNNEFFVFGESYGGKYAPAVSYTIHQNNPSAVQKINLKGIAIGSGWVDPQHFRNRSDHLYQTGLIDFKDRRKISEKEKGINELIEEKKWQEAITLQVDTFNRLTELVGKVCLYNYIRSEDYDVLLAKFSYLRRPDIKSALHVGNINFRIQNWAVFRELMDDFMQSVGSWISILLSNYRTLFYNGQLDTIVAYPLTVNFLRQLNFSAAEEYMTAKKHRWLVEGDLAGYVKQAGNLTEVLVRYSGHIVVRDQPAWTNDLITKFTRNQSFY